MKAYCIVLIGENKKELQRLRELFKKEGYEVYHAINGGEEVKRVKECSADLIVIVTNSMDEKEKRLISKLREYSAIPIIMLAEQEEMDWFSMGADQFIIHPFSENSIIQEANSQMCWYRKYLEKQYLLR